MSRSSHASRILLLAGALGCAAPAQETPPAGDIAAGDTARGTQPADTTQTPPPPPLGTRSAGTLNWEELSVRMVGRGTNAGLRIDVTTLDDQALAVAAEDIRAYLLDLKSRAREEAGLFEPESDRRRSFLVGYTGFEKQVSFDPTLLQVRSEGFTHYPQSIVPLSADFQRRIVDLYETVYGIYFFAPELDLNATLEFRYADLSSGSAWRGVVDRIQRAQARRETQSTR